MNQLVEYYNLILYNPALKSIFIVLLSIISAKVQVDIIFTIVFKKIVDKTDTELDNKIIYLLHKDRYFIPSFLWV